MSGILSNTEYKIKIDHTLEKIQFLAVPNIGDYKLIFTEDETSGNEFNLELATPDTLKFENNTEHIYELYGEDDNNSDLEKDLNNGNAFIVCDPECLGVPKYSKGNTHSSTYSSTIMWNNESFNYTDVFTMNDFVSFMHEDSTELMFIYNKNFYKIHHFEFVYCCYRPLTDDELIKYSNYLKAIKRILHQKIS